MAAAIPAIPLPAPLITNIRPTYRQIKTESYIGLKCFEQSIPAVCSFYTGCLCQIVMERIFPGKKIENGALAIYALFL